MTSSAFAKPIVPPTLDLPLRNVDEVARYVADRLDPHKSNADELALLAELEGARGVSPGDELHRKVTRLIASMAV